MRSAKSSAISVMSKASTTPLNTAMRRCPKRLAIAAAELVRVPVDVIATYGTPATRAAKQADDDTHRRHFGRRSCPCRGCRKLARPGGNVTGNSLLPWNGANLLFRCAGGQLNAALASMMQAPGWLL